MPIIILMIGALVSGVDASAGVMVSLLGVVTALLEFATAVVEYQTATADKQ